MLVWSLPLKSRERLFVKWFIFFHISDALVRYVIDSDFMEQNGSTHGRVFVTFPRSVLLNRTWNRVNNCCVNTFHSIPMEREPECFFASPPQVSMQKSCKVEVMPLKNTPSNIYIYYYYKWQQKWCSRVCYVWLYFLWSGISNISYDFGKGSTCQPQAHAYLFFWLSSFTTGCDSKWCGLEDEYSVTLFCCLLWEFAQRKLACAVQMTYPKHPFNPYMLR